MTNPDTNPVGFLQEICQKHGKGFPVYEEIDSSGAPHCKEFTVKCSFENEAAIATSRLKKQAKSEAAKAMVAILKEKNYFDKYIKNGEDEPLTLMSTESKNPISILMEYCQKNACSQPKFSESSAALGTFVCECKLKDQTAYGNGTNKKTAKTEAAFKMCKQLGIIFKDVEYLPQELQPQPNSMGKNPVSALQEFCQQNSSFKNPEYVELPQEKNLFVIECSLGSIKCKGRSTSKKDAKTQAANLVLTELLAQDEDRITSSGESRSAIGTVIPVSGALQHFNIDTSSEEEDHDEDDNKSSKVTDTNLPLKMEALSLEPETRSDKKVEEDQIESRNPKEVI